MRKAALLTATLLSIACLGGQSLTARAAVPSSLVTSQGKSGVVFTYIGKCDSASIIEQLKNCLPGFDFSDCDNIGNGGSGGSGDNGNEDSGNGGSGDNGSGGNGDNGNGGSGDNGNGGSGDNGNGSDNDSSEDITDQSYAAQVVALVNEERAKEGLSPLTMDSQVQAAAQVRAVESEQSFSHTRPDGRHFSTALTEQNVSYRGAGENIAWGQRSPEAVVAAWMNSAGHRANIMSAKFTTIGVGYHQNANGTNYWSQLFTY